MRQRVENDLFLERETSSRAILNSDNFGYSAVYNNKLKKKESEKELKDEIAELKALVAQLIKDR